ncbi:hypothetical protein AYM40_21015 [Paraburkholderia phytofirmans OLGA172]|uniref:CHASE2 domain-containing protein n=1 Tax=Paraburkholderia phytofirmans OLGA172 TaxID=1417228 RepID=A0A160FQI8_9BURK|nr:CHASE2 domain-containing protein [Paraburkholderia phytofirmans]ANB74934.1 hypothetical protein AYM40_21015 [Paraburkholderia phytofirmans OLGA172]
MAANLVVCYAFVVLLGQHNVWEVRDFVFDLQAQLFHALPVGSRQVTIVSIEQDDYKQIFHDQSPLNDQKLRKLIEKILEGNPAALGVDIQTADPQFQSLDNLPDLNKVVWARASISKSEDRIDPGDVLGDSPATLISGVAVFPDDSEDSATRRYQRRVNTTRGAEDTFAWAIAKQSWKESSKGSVTSPNDDFVVRDVRYTDFPPRPEHTASQVIAPGFGWNGSIDGKIVLLGGRYDAADKHKTPYAGEMDGVDVLANAIETEINHRSQASVTRLQLFFLAISQVLVLNWLFSWKSFGLALTISLIFVLDAVPLFYLSGSFQLWPYSALLTILVIMEEGVVHFNHKVNEMMRKYFARKDPTSEGEGDKEADTPHK